MGFSMLNFAHEWIAGTPVPAVGAVAVDATVGNGHDTLFLAEWLGPDGVVHGFDVQADALAEARRRCESATTPRAVIHWHETGHEHAAAVLAQAGVVAVSAVMFNLGYRPGGDKTRVTRPDTTRAALDALSARLAPGGRLTVVAYPGHPGGREETDAVLAWAAGLEAATFTAAHHRWLNRGAHRPEVIALERRLPR